MLLSENIRDPGPEALALLSELGRKEGNYKTAIKDFLVESLIETLETTEQALGEGDHERANLKSLEISQIMKDGGISISSPKIDNIRTRIIDALTLTQ